MDFNLFRKQKRKELDNLAYKSFQVVNKSFKKVDSDLNRSTISQKFQTSKISKLIENRFETSQSGSKAGVKTFKEHKDDESAIFNTITRIIHKNQPHFEEKNIQKSAEAILNIFTEMKKLPGQTGYIMERIYPMVTTLILIDQKKLFDRINKILEQLNRTYSKKFAFIPKIYQGMPQHELTIQLTELLETSVLEENIRIIKDGNLYIDLKTKYEELLGKDIALRNLYEKEIDSINEKWRNEKFELDNSIQKLKEEIRITNGINQKFSNLKIEDQEMTLNDLHANMVENNKQISDLKSQNMKIRKEKKKMGGQIAQLKLTASIVGGSNIELKNIIKAVRKENEDLVTLNKQIMKHKNDKTNPKLKTLAECFGVVTISDKLKLERIEFSEQIDWIMKRFQGFIYGIYQILMERETSQIKKLQIELKKLIDKWGMFKKIFAI